MKKEIWEEFIKWGSGWKLEADRDYKQKGNPFCFHLKMFGLYYPDNYELVGRDLEKLLKQAIKDGSKRLKNYEIGKIN